MASPLRNVTFPPLTARRDDKWSGHTSPGCASFLAGVSPPAIAGRRSERKAKRSVFLEVKGSERCFTPLCGRISLRRVRHRGHFRKQQKKLLCDSIRADYSQRLGLINKYESARFSSPFALTIHQGLDFFFKEMYEIDILLRFQNILIHSQTYKV